VAMRIGRWSVFVAWLLLVGSLVRDRLPLGSIEPPADGATALVGADGDQDDWMGVYLQDRKIGYTHHHLRRTDGGYEFSERSVLKIAVLGSPQTVRTVAHGQMTAELALKKFSLSLDGGVASMNVAGEVDQGGLALRMTTGGQEQKQHLDTKGPLYMPLTARSRLAAMGLEAGRSLKVEAFDPSAMAGHPIELVVEGRAALELGGEKRDAWLVHESFRGLQSRVWLDDEGRVLKEEGPMGLVALREEPKVALSGGWETDAAFDLTAAVAIPVKQPLANPRSLDALTVRLGGLGELEPIDDGRQSYRQGVLHIARENVGALGSYSLPYAAERWRDDLAATPFLQVDDPSIRRASAEALGGETDARRAADRLRRWVFDSLAKVPTASIPNAVQVLQMRAGDCNEHAVLYAALARAAGLPARVIAGVVYLDGAFLYHAWNEVWLGGGWLSVDAALDQLPADATHIKLLSGGPEAHAALAAVVGRLSIEIVPDQEPGA
jgi:Transglutaminase-like superfamily